jgi:hypothetical protein
MIQYDEQFQLTFQYYCWGSRRFWTGSGSDLSKKNPDPDLTPEKSSDPDHALRKILNQPFVTRHFWLKMALKAYSIYELKS